MTTLANRARVVNMESTALGKKEVKEVYKILDFLNSKVRELDLGRLDVSDGLGDPIGWIDKDADGVWMFTIGDQ